MPRRAQEQLVTSASDTDNTAEHTGATRRTKSGRPAQRSSGEAVEGTLETDLCCGPLKANIKQENQPEAIKTAREWTQLYAKKK